MSVRLFDAHGEVRVGDIARYGKKPVIVERFGVDPQLKTPVVHVVTMDERKHFIKLLPYQLGMVVGGSESEAEDASSAGSWEAEDVAGGNEWTGAKEGNHGTL